MTTLTDAFRRRIRYLRLSVTDRCDLRCVYCMAEDMTFLPRHEVLSLEELARLARVFVDLGVEKIRLTGGEPLVRQNLPWLVRELAGLPGLRELALTSNGMRLAEQAPALRAAGLQRLNISLDSLDPARFRAITRVGELARVQEGLAAAKAAGFGRDGQRIKLNSVILRGRNDDEVEDLVAFAQAQDCDITFIEEMPLGVIDEHDRALAFVSSDEILARLEQRFTLLPGNGSGNGNGNGNGGSSASPPDHGGPASLNSSGSDYSPDSLRHDGSESPDSPSGPARYWRLAGSATRIGFISPHSHNFCASCNRVRLTVEGRLLLCLGNEHSLDLRHLLREEKASDAELRAAIIAAVLQKPERHYFDLHEPVQIVRFMNMTGG